MSADYAEYKRKMQKTCDLLSENLAAVRAGKANAAVLDRITVDYYNTPTPINQVASISTPDPRSLLITPWDGSVLKGIEKAILASELGINPQNDGRAIRLIFPQLTEERRKELAKQVKKYSEKPRSPCATSAATPWTRPRPRKSPARSPRTITRTSKRTCRS